ncbi:metallophosphoesterase [Achromobacter ruhlandii]|uniref:metallophosphoesterase n=1 Tax=Achromobacter ruhlandii TaxID=72557 RepID=UPI0021F220F0|nr:metallophosphoesterase [Achromobacter ruhlandii]MCV6798101.1 metallophosphoesterase [Achromobacter ruhlandii]MCV6804221.1 metallophosphoesterase [Achromobacter ruhlandii]MCV6810346.1 metallophosphoesterase [Achromobacter ruhlandii]MCV6818435.1 metallophosphoesterase [Achromobacter ruhlandii]
MYDIIGDIHGEDRKLEGLLRHLGYVPAGKGYKAPQGRQAVFLGDLVDRGKGQRRVLEIVRAMMDDGQALCIMGNHEFNAIGYVTEDPHRPGECLRPNRGDSEKSRKNRKQHGAFISQIGEGSPEHVAWVAWFRQLPPYLDLGGIRAAHACWDDGAVKTLNDAGWLPGKPLDDALLVATHQKGSALEQARKRLTSGVELALPDGRYIEDKEGHRHYEVRLANWRDWASALHEVALVPAGQEAQIHGLALPEDFDRTPITGAPVFIGHHWFKGPPRIESAKLACLDWSAAAGGPLVAYRWDGEATLSNDKLAWERG